MTLQEFLDQVDGNINNIITYSEDEALEAVKQDGFALRYVKEQTQDICLAAVKQDVDALQFVNEKVFDQKSNN
tara:strand:+ start:1393 stop:1611 length:219 start_codon:yes stop_codon:yes gene_type:complete